METVEKWRWMMDYCKERGLPPAHSWAWDMAERAFNKLHDFTCIEHNDYGKEKCKVQCPYCEKI